MKRQAAALLMALGLLTALAGCGTREAEVSASPEPTPTVTAAPAPSASPEPLETPEPFDGTIFVSCEQSGLANTYEGYIALKADALLPTVSIEGRDEAAKAMTRCSCKARSKPLRRARVRPTRPPAKPSTPWTEDRARDLARPRLEQQRDGHPGRRRCAQPALPDLFLLRRRARQLRLLRPDLGTVTGEGHLARRACGTTPPPCAKR